MDKIKITCDSTCDLTPELYRDNDVEVIPLGVLLGDDQYYDGVDIKDTDIFGYVARTGILPRTSAIPIDKYFEVFGRYKEQGFTVIHINISSELSACWNNASYAARELGNVIAVDSRSLSSGSGHLVLEAARMVREGMDAPAIAAELEEMKQRLDVSFIIQTLEYLNKGGRCSDIALLGANLLKLRPEIVVADGTMHTGAKYRGTMETTLVKYVDGRLKGRTDLDLSRIFVTHSAMDPAAVSRVIARVRELQPFEQVIETNAGCTVSSHCGDRCLGVLFFRKKEAE